VAFGTIAIDGSITNPYCSQGTLSCVLNNSGAYIYYEITLGTISYQTITHTTVATVEGTTLGMCTTSAGSGKLRVYTYNSSGNSQEQRFHFVVFKN
jgi:hypothetical protein